MLPADNTSDLIPTGGFPQGVASYFSQSVNNMLTPEKLIMVKIIILCIAFITVNRFAALVDDCRLEGFWLFAYGGINTAEGAEQDFIINSY